MYFSPSAENSYSCSTAGTHWAEDINNIPFSLLFFPKSPISLFSTVALAFLGEGGTEEGGAFYLELDIQKLFS